MGQGLGKALPVVTVIALLTSLGFTFPLIPTIEYGPLTFNTYVKSVDIIEEGLYNFTLDIHITNTNLTEIFITQANIGIYYDSTKYSTISSQYIEGIIIPGEETTIYSIDGYVALVNDVVPQKVYSAVSGKYTIGSEIIDIEYGLWIDLTPYWPG